jgi:hypothetical protein
MRVAMSLAVPTITLAFLAAVVEKPTDSKMV